MLQRHFMLLLAANSLTAHRVSRESVKAALREGTTSPRYLHYSVCTYSSSQVDQHVDRPIDDAMHCKEWIRETLQ